ncbi:MAG: pyridoxamine 5'-phosphate oxidase family protein [Candidatus Thorarchaeota archaeon]|nr:pyridoxamine 5'-phosphate oxidase family protein [Candidatus Thorarchaeota archaeon]
MDLNPEVKKRIDKVLKSQSIAVLGTSKDDEPYSSLVGFVMTDDLRELVFATMRQRLKYRNMLANPRVTFMIDDRNEQNNDFNETTSITIVGSAEDVKAKEREEYASLLVKRHPVLSDFVSSPDCAVIRVAIDKIFVVSDFESVVKIGIPDYL